MTREKMHQVTVVKEFVDLIHKFQRATNYSLFSGSPSWGVSRISIPEFDFTFDRGLSRGWADAAKSFPDTWEMEIVTPDVLVSARVSTPVSFYTMWEDLSTKLNAKWNVEIVGDLSSLSDVSTWLKLSWPVD
jgi:hypothetical protein